MALERTVAATGAAASGELAVLSWPQLDAAGPLVLVPVGSTEQHGPHLPLATDTMIATAVAEGVRDRLDTTGGSSAVVVAPAIAYGASGEHEDFPGTVSIGHEALRLVLIEYGRSACRWAGGVVFVNGHGGNVTTLTEAVDLLRSEGRRVGWAACAASDGDAHAGRTETSVLLHLASTTVDRTRAVAGATAPLSDLLPALRARGVRAVSANGVLGDPAHASAGEGATVLAAMIDRVAGEIGRLGAERPPASPTAHHP